jgi:6-phosphogluconate dehydrogenase
MVKAGDAVDAFANSLSEHLEAGDIIIDAGNSHFADTVRRVTHFEKYGIHFVGCGVSGGEEGARHGPSIMPGGSIAAWPHVSCMLEAISARAEDGTPCCAWVGGSGSGHFVKMVHNGIEYGDMQVIAEAYDIMRRVLAMDNSSIAKVFSEWNEGDMASYLVEITADILSRKEESGADVVDTILDTAQQKGTGRWTVETALALGVPLTLIAESVQARAVSSQKAERIAASKVFAAPKSTALSDSERRNLLADLRKAVFASKIVSYAQGFSLMNNASQSYSWGLNLGRVALLWRGGCIIRSRFLADINRAFEKNPTLSNLLMDSFFSDIIKDAQLGWRNIVGVAIARGIPLPCISSALAYFDAYRSQNLPANLIQAQRDYFGAHSYERVDSSRGTYFHSEWISTASGKSVPFNEVK